MKEMFMLCIIIIITVNKFVQLLDTSPLHKKYNPLAIHFSNDIGENLQILLSLFLWEYFVKSFFSRMYFDHTHAFFYKTIPEVDLKCFIRCTSFLGALFHGKETGN